MDILTYARFQNACRPPSGSTSLSMHTHLHCFPVVLSVFQPQSTWLFLDIWHEAPTLSSVPHGCTVDQRDGSSEWRVAAGGGAKTGSSFACRRSPGRRIRNGWYGLQNRQRTLRDRRLPSDPRYRQLGNSPHCISLARTMFRLMPSSRAV